MELIEFEILLYNRRQAVYTFSNINICRGNVNLFGVDSQHLFSPPNTNSEKYTSFPLASSSARSIQYLRVLRFMPFSRQNFRPLSLLSVNFLTNKVPSCSVTTTIIIEPRQGFLFGKPCFLLKISLFLLFYGLCLNLQALKKA